MRRFLPGIATILFVSIVAFAQEETAKQIYSAASDSVVMIYIQDSDSKPIGQGSGFIIDNNRIVTNAHVIRDGKPFLMIGPAKIPVKVDQIDSVNDLAVLIPAVELTATPLKIAPKDSTPGEAVFAIGNPEGLEKTISQGIVSAVRDFDGRKLVQITSPVSHGSSGGPVLDKNGQVVAVTVGMLKEGQNLNFAVPASLVSHFLSKHEKTDERFVLSNSLVELRAIASERGRYSKDPDSDWQKGQIKIGAILSKLIEDNWNSSQSLKDIVAASGDLDSSLTLTVRQRLVTLDPSPDNYIDLADSLYWSVLFAANDDSKKKSVLVEAETNARSGIRKAKSPTVHAYLTLAKILNTRERCGEAEGMYKHSLSTNVAEEEMEALRGIIDCADTLNKIDEVEQSFGVLVTKKYATAWDWKQQADRLSKRQLFERAAESYQISAALAADNDFLQKYDLYSDAANNYWKAGKTDNCLDAARACIREGEGKDGADSDLAFCHRAIAAILNGRNVYTEALSHSKESIALNNSDPMAYQAMADALLGLGRAREALNAATQALKLSDGKWGFTHFTLGSAYFEMEDWHNAEQSFRKASDLTPNDTAAPYNVALCLAKQGYYHDAASWYEEVLRRNPRYKERDEILQKIKVLRSR